MAPLFHRAAIMKNVNTVNVDPTTYHVMCTKLIIVLNVWIFSRFSEALALWARSIYRVTSALRPIILQWQAASTISAEITQQTTKSTSHRNLHQFGTSSSWEETFFFSPSPWTLTYDLIFKLDLHRVKVHQRAKYLGQRSLAQKLLLGHTDRHTHTPTRLLYLDEESR